MSLGPSSEPQRVPVTDAQRLLWQAVRRALAGIIAAIDKVYGKPES